MNARSRLYDALKSVDTLAGAFTTRYLCSPRRPMPAAPQDVLAIRLWGLGNLALLAPQFHAARGSHRVRLLTLERNGDFVTQHTPWIKPLLLPDPASLRFAPRLARILRNLRRDSPEVIIDFEQFLRLPLWAVRTATGAPSVGLNTPGQGRLPLLDQVVPYDPTRHVADTFAALWDAAGLPAANGPGPLNVAPSALPASIAAKLDRNSARRPLVVLHPGSGDHFPGRRWPPERFGQLASRLAQRASAQIVITGLPDERRLIRRVRESLGSTAHLDLSGELDTSGLVALLARANLLITNDTGPLHLADAVGTLAVALYGPNTPHRYGPRKAGSRAVFADLPCSPCLDDRSMKRSKCEHFACMEAVNVDVVEKISLELLEQQLPHPHRESLHAVSR
ncbi:MAG: glycosyltransferase family 9 protein [Planctomycetota bacterium]|jgi:ADP-heptose:LPS heptosyltransferase|nr:glycosyltransferase family 9 protein [Planctomycetota bacterium]